MFSYEARTCESSEIRHSFANGRVKNDSWTERYYFIKKEEVTHEEYEWLNTFIDEIEVPKGYVRVANDTHDLFRVPEVPGRNDVLVVKGKTGSRRGVRSYGELFRGHPSECHLSSYALFKGVTLNGKALEHSYVGNLDRWKKSREIARWALKNAGIHKKDDSSFLHEEFDRYVEAVAQYYKDHDLIG